MRLRRAILLAVLAGGLASCGGSAAPQSPPPARLERLHGSSTPSVILTPLGAQRIGIQTAPVAGGSARGNAVLPYSAVVYEPDGSPVVYTNPAPLTYTLMRISIAGISGDRVSTTSGPAPGTKVVTVGAEELLGVQTGVVPES